MATRTHHGRDTRACKGCSEQFPQRDLRKVIGNKAAGGSVGSGYYCDPCHRLAFVLLGVS